MNRFPSYLLIAAAVGVLGCEPPDDQETGSLSSEDVLEARESLDPAVAAALDSGNVAYRAENYEEALRHFRRVTELNEDVAAGWFGLYMAELALGNVERANVAMERAQRLAPGASLIRADTGEAAGGAVAPADSAP